MRSRTGRMALAGLLGAGVLVATIAPAGAQAPLSVTVCHTQDIGLIDPARGVLLNELNNLWVNIYETLVSREPGGRLVPAVAESWEVKSPTEWVFKIRHGITFHDGETLNAEAVKATLDRYQEKDKPRYGAVAAGVKDVTVIDPYTVRITTPTPDAAFLERLFEVPILPPGYLKQVGEQGFLQKPVGSGPYRWVEWVKGSHVTLEANPKYWRGEPAVKRATFKLIPEIATRVSALKAGECDIALQVPPDLIEDVEKTGTVRIAPAESPRIIYFILYPQSTLGGGAPLNDLRVRQAINHAVDVDKIIKFILNGQAVRVATLYGRQTAGFDPEVKPYEYNPQKAKELLAQAGFANGFTIGLDAPIGGNPIKPVEVAQAVAADLEKVGIKTQMRTLDTATYAQMKFGYKLAPILMWNWMAFEADYILYAQAHSKAQFFHYPVHSPEVDRLMEQERSELNPTKRLAVLKAIQQKVRDDAPFLVLYQQKDIFGVNKRLDWNSVPGGYLYLTTIKSR